MKERKEYIAKMKENIEKWNIDIYQMEEKMKGASSEAKTEYNRQLDAIKAKRDEAELKLTELQQAADGTWEDFKTGMEHAWGSVSQAFSSARNKLSRR